MLHHNGKQRTCEYEYVTKIVRAHNKRGFYLIANSACPSQALSPGVNSHPLVLLNGRQKAASWRKIVLKTLAVLV